MARDEVIRIKVTPEVKAKYIAMCQALGLSESGLGAYIMGQWIMQQETMVKPMLDRIGQAMEGSAKEMIGKQIDMMAMLGDKQ